MCETNIKETGLRVFPPLYLVGKNISCWKCDGKMPAIALVAPKLAEIDAKVCILTNIDGLPQEILEYLEKRVPTFKFTFSKMGGGKYYANTCPHCGMLSGDFYLHSEPGAPFFPMDEEEAGHLYLTEIPIKLPVFIQTGYHIGAGDLIISHARRIA